MFYKYLFIFIILFACEGLGQETTFNIGEEFSLGYKEKAIAANKALSLIL